MATVTLRLLAAAREAAGSGSVTLTGDTVGEVLLAARARFGPAFGAVLDASRVWVDGDEPVAGDATRLDDGAEVAVLPPVSGG